MLWRSILLNSSYGDELQRDINATSYIQTTIKRRRAVYLDAESNEEDPIDFSGSYGKNDEQIQHQEDSLVGVDKES